MRVACLALAILFATVRTWGYEVSVGSALAGPGTRVSVPVSVGGLQGVANVGVCVAYDPHVLKFVKAEKGSLASMLSDDFLVDEDSKSGTVSVSAFATGDLSDEANGSLANLVFDIREGTQGLYSEISVLDVRLGEKTGVKDVTVGNPIMVGGGMVRVMAVDSADRESMSMATTDRVRKMVAARLPMAATSLRVSGPKGKVDAIAALGIGPKLSVEGAVATAEYGEPLVQIIDFEPKTGRVRLKVMPSEGNSISAEPATECIRVYGTDDLAREMQLISSKSVDLSEYLKAESKGEATIYVDLKSNRFVSVRCQ